MDNFIVKNLLAHSNMATTERYMGNFDTSENDKALESIFERSTISQEEELLQLFSRMTPEEKSSLIQKYKR